MPTIVGSPVPEALAQRTRDIAARLRAGERVADKDIVSVIAELTELSLEHQFINTARALGAGRTIMKFIELNTGASLKTIKASLGKVIPRLNANQRRKLADFFDDALYRDLAH